MTWGTWLLEGLLAGGQSEAPDGDLLILLRRATRKLPTKQPPFRRATCPYGTPRSDRPACELVPEGERPQDAHHHLLGALVHCNLRLAPDGLRRLAATVDAAMLRWAAQHRRYDVLPGGGGAGEEGVPEAALAAEHGGEASGEAGDAWATAAGDDASAVPAAAAEQQQEEKQQQQREGRKQQQHRKAWKDGGGRAADR